VSRTGHLKNLADLPRSRFNIKLQPFGLAKLTQQRTGDDQTPNSKK
jgi:hypothetical protein